MGSLLAPVLANLFMGHHEKLWLENVQGKLQRCQNLRGDIQITAEAMQTYGL